MDTLTKRQLLRATILALGAALLLVAWTLFGDLLMGVPIGEG